MKKKKRVIWCIIALLVVGLAAWRLWPRSIDSFMKRPISEADRVSCYLNTAGIEDGKFEIYTYSFETGNHEESQAVLYILRSGRYQASFANLLPWTWGSLSSGFGYDGRNIMVTVMYDGEEPWAAILIFYGNSNGNVDGRQINPIGNDMFNELAEYIQENGIVSFHEDFS